MIQRVGMGLVIFGLVICVVTGIDLSTRDEVENVTDNTTPMETETYMAWTPIIGGIIMFAGGGIAVHGVIRQRRRDAQEHPDRKDRCGLRSRGHSQLIN